MSFLNREMSNKGKELVLLYKHMAENGYFKHDGSREEKVFSDMEVRHYKNKVKDLLKTIGLNLCWTMGAVGRITI